MVEQATAAGHVVQRKASGAAEASGADAHKVAASGVSAATAEFPHRQTIETLFGRPVGARAALGGEAAEACDSLGAHAYTRGDQVAFASSSPDLHLAAHEAAHTVQQRQGVQLSGGFGRAGDAHERMADEAADRVTRGESAADLFGGGGAAGVAPAGVQMQLRPDDGGGEGWQAVLAAIRRAGPAGPHDYLGALRALAKLSMADMLRALQEVAKLGEFDNFFVEAGLLGSTRTRTAFWAIYIERNVGSVGRSQLDDLNRMLLSVSIAEQVTLVAHIADVTGRGGNNEVLAEGVAAAVQSASSPMAAASATAPSPVGPGAWNPPGKQPIPFYIGNEAHAQIAERYEKLHTGQQVFTNSTPFSTILSQIAGAQRAAVDKAKLALMPDIANITLRHLYEIKPQAMVAEAQAKLSTYLGIFATAGVPMIAGSPTEPGTAGVLEAPGGYYMYECPMPGIVLYQYRRGQYQPVPVPDGQTERQTEPDFWRRMELATGLTGAALVIYLIVSEGSRIVFPLRNAVPAP